MRTKLLITGSTGFVGKRFVELKHHKYDLVLTDLRKTPLEAIDLSDINAIVYLAGLAHQTKKIAPSSYFEVNTKLPVRLAECAKDKGVPHFIYISSIKVYGDLHVKGLTEMTACVPNDPYGASKYEAERSLNALNDNDFHISIIRPPLIYGPGVKGNMLTLMRAIENDRILPLKNIANQRSILFVDNLIALIDRIIEKKVPGLFLPSDDHDVSTEQLINYIAAGLKKKPRLLSIPSLLRYSIKLCFPGIHKRLFGSLTLDHSDSYKRAGFSNPYTTEHGVNVMTEWFKTFDYAT